MNTQEFYTEMTEKMIRALETGTAPWTRPWKVIGDGIPVNAITGKPYRGINTLNLYWNAFSQGTSDMRYATFKQAKEKGWKVKTGSKGTPILKLVPVQKKEKTEAAEETETNRENKLLIPKVYYVFSAKDLEGVPAIEEAPRPNWSNKVEGIRQKISSALGVPVNHGGDRAFYKRSDDRIQIPSESAFKNKEAYLGVLLHEFGHATGHEKRLNRPFGVFGAPEYAFEELVAEMISLFVGMSTGITPDEGYFANHAAYIDSWIQVLKKDKKALVRASALGQEACDLLVANL